MKGLIGLLAMLTFCSCGTKPGDGEIPPGAFSERHLEAVDYVREIDSMRTNLAATIGRIEPDLNTFIEVCKPVGRRAEEISDETGWTIEQMAVKYRNPSNKADEQATAVIERMENIKGLQSVWEKVKQGSSTGWRYFEKIEVQPACLACHGEKDERPSFIVNGYPEDRAYDFEVGDIRGVYSVFVPDSTYGR